MSEQTSNGDNSTVEAVLGATGYAGTLDCFKNPGLSILVYVFHFLHTHTHANRHTHKHSHAHMYIYTHAHTYTRTQARGNTPAHTHTHARADTCTKIRAHIYLYHSHRHTHASIIAPTRIKAHLRTPCLQIPAHLFVFCFQRGVDCCWSLWRSTHCWHNCLFHHSSNQKPHRDERNGPASSTLISHAY